jgi:CheY-like chemotaxis protein
MNECGDISGKRILFVDDEELLCELAAEVLGDSGCSVLTAENGGVAGKTYKAEGGHFDLVITDWRMPEMNGRDLIIDLRERGYTGPVLLVSSHINENNTEHFHTAFHVRHLLPKPFTAEQLTEKVAYVLNEQP